MSVSVTDSGLFETSQRMRRDSESPLETKAVDSEPRTGLLVRFLIPRPHDGRAPARRAEIRRSAPPEGQTSRRRAGPRRLAPGRGG